MSVQKYKRSTGAKSDSIHSAYSFSQDVNLLQDYEYLLQKSAEELSKVKEQNQFLEQQLESVQPFTNNQYSTFQFNKNDILIEQLKLENTDLKLKLEAKTKANKKLKNKCKQFDQIINENTNLKQDLQDLLKEKINNKENRSISAHQPSKCISIQQQFSKTQKIDSSISYNCKALEEADKFLMETKLHSSRIIKYQPPPTPKQQDIQPIVFNFGEIDLQNNIILQEHFLNYIEQINVKAQEQLTLRVQNQQFEKLIQANSDLEKYVLELCEQNWILTQKNKIQSDLMKDLMKLCEEKNQKQLFELIKLNEVEDGEELTQLDSICKEIAQNTQILNEKTQDLVQSCNTQKENVKQQYWDQNKENKINNSNKQNQTASQIQKTYYEHPKVDLKEFEQLKYEYQRLFKEIEIMQMELQEYDQQDNDHITKQELFQILEKFNDEISYRESTSIKDQIIVQIDILQQEKEQYKIRYLELLYKIILNQIKTDARRTELLVKNDIKLQEAMKWLLQSTNRSSTTAIIFQNCDILIELISRKQNHSGKMSELHDIIKMQMKIIYTLLQSLQNEKLQSSRTSYSRNEKQDSFVNQAIQDLKELNKKISNLPDNDDDPDLKFNILQLCNKMVK